MIEKLEHALIAIISYPAYKKSHYRDDEVYLTEKIIGDGVTWYHAETLDTHKYQVWFRECELEFT